MVASREANKIVIQPSLIGINIGTRGGGHGANLCSHRSLFL